MSRFHQVVAATLLLSILGCGPTPEERVRHATLVVKRLRNSIEHEDDILSAPHIQIGVQQGVETQLGLRGQMNPEDISGYLDKKLKDPTSQESVAYQRILRTTPDAKALEQAKRMLVRAEEELADAKAELKSTSGN